MIRLFSLLTIACWGGAILLLATDAESNAVVAIVLILLAAGLSAILAARSAYLRVKGFADDARGFLSGDIQHVRLVSVGDPSGWFTPAAPVTLEFQGADGEPHLWERDIPVPFPYAWGYRLGKRFNVPGLKQLDPTALLATQLRREGVKLTLSRPGAAPAQAP